MNLYLRLFWVLLKGRLGRYGSAINVVDPATIKLRVLPNDLDLNKHLNNGRYATMMDIGRLSLMQRCGVLRQARENGWYAVVSACNIQFKRPIKLFQEIELTTRLVCWNERCFVLKQVFYCNGKECATGWVKGQLRSGKRAVPINEVFGAIHFSGESPEMPQELPWGETRAA